MAAALGNDLDSEDLECSAPLFVLHSCSGEKIHKSQIQTVVKMDCTYSNCNQSGFMHNECLREMEDQMVKLLQSNICNSGKTQAFRRFNWNCAKDRELLWKDDNKYGFIYKNLRCNCGRGFLRRDLTWPPATYRRQRRKINGQTEGLASHLPKLKTSYNGGGAKIHYIPSVQPNFPVRCPEVADEKSSSLPPGAQYVDRNLILKRGKIVMWNQVSGLIKNLNNPDERPVGFGVESVQGGSQGLEVGAEVQYRTQRRKKKIEVVSVVLVKSVIYQQGVVTHWSPAHLAGIIQAGNKEIIVSRKDFLPGGFIGDIIGKVVKFKEEDEEATCVSIVKEFHYDEKTDLVDIKFTDLELLAAPFLKRIEDLDIAFLEEIVLGLSDEEWDKLIGELFPFLVKVAAHCKGYRVLLLLAEHSEDQTKERIVRKISASFFPLSTTTVGAGCIVDLLGIIPPELTSLVLLNYENIESCQKAEDHMSGPQSQFVFQACLPLLEGSALRSLTNIISPCSVLARLSAHPSLAAMITRAKTEDSHSLYLLMASLDREDKIMQDSFTPLISQLMQHGGNKCCGVILHNISGKLQSVLTYSHGRQILTFLFQFASDLQLYLVVEEMFQGNDETTPLFVQLASELDDTGMILKALVTRLNVETMERILELFKQEMFRSRIIGNVFGRMWLKVLSKRVNGGK